MSGTDQPAETTTDVLEDLYGKFLPSLSPAQRRQVAEVADEELREERDTHRALGITHPRPSDYKLTRTVALMKSFGDTS